MILVRGVVHVFAPRDSKDSRALIGDLGTGGKTADYRSTVTKSF